MGEYSRVARENRFSRIAADKKAERRKEAKISRFSRALYVIHQQNCAPTGA